MYDIPMGKERRNMGSLFTSWKLKSLDMKNRVCVLPGACVGWNDDSGMTTEMEQPGILERTGRHSRRYDSEKK